MSSLILNRINNIENYSYLELGVFNNYNYDSIKCQNKFSVDINGLAKYTGTTDDFFDQLEANKRFDIIFIDANHDYDYVIKDFNNSIDHADKWILIHDMVPPTLSFTESHLCSDSFKLLYYFHKEEKFELYTTVENYGLTFIKIPARKVYPSESYRDVSYETFVQFLNTSVRLYHEQELVDFFNREKKF